MTVEERATIPLDGLVFAFGAMVPFPVGAVVAWLAEGATAVLAASLTTMWGAAILIFLSGVRRGLSFRTPGGPRGRQLGIMLWLFCAGLGALLVPVVLALSLLFAGYLSLLVLDPLAAHRDEAPLYFARLRPWQMAIPVASLGLLLAAIV